MGEKYLSVNQDGSFGFKDDAINDILDSDIVISDEIYNQFFAEQSQGKQFKVKNSSGATFEEIFEEYMPDPIEREPSDVEILQQQNAQLLLQSAQQAQMINDLQTQNAAIMLQMAQMGGAS
ncbi:hypothetical protein NIE88_18945 [Sporolactobacillus shoreicorticis]|uniref:Uncharacterized protein n=1 Tax=Sporolactobacillus shoreicorticis TaxID=1923877 RepID=A0ABW5S912_9BACL|nr:hypothetical protein [Sporolactobacillus shoreicorticis]MCO7127828.1 hypothetical protein [Sporolactobacillus shoreicorticis]